MRAQAAIASMATRPSELAAWTLWLGGWLGFGAWGMQHWPLAAGGLAALALWLAAIAGVQALGPRRHLTALGLVLAGAAWALGLPSPWPALLAAALALVAAARAAGWRRCALLPLSRAPGRDPAGWPRWAAAAVMLPMMAGLPAMASWCSSVGWPLPVMLALHVALMLLPAWAWPGRPGPAVVGATMVAGAAMLLLWPGLGGLMAASLVQALACGLAWRAAATPPGRRLAGATVLPALSVLALGMALVWQGPSALMVVHAALGAVAGAGALLSAGRRRPATRSDCVRPR
jgi:hypothetical protein